MVDVYLGIHQPPVASARSETTTLVSPVPLPAHHAAGYIHQHNQVPLVHVRHTHLDYPEMPVDPATGLELVAQRYARCGRCHLSENRTFVVLHRGDPYSPVCLLGEGPGKDEDGRGYPFVGRSGKLQDGILGLETCINPASVSWINLVGCRPCASRFVKKDRPPDLVEKIACSERTLMLLRALRPRVVMLLGQQAALAFFEKVPPVNTWHILQDPAHPADWVALGYVRHPAGLLRMLPSPNAYREFAALKLFWAGLRDWMPELEKVVKWRFGFRYLEGLVPTTSDGSTK